MNDKINPNLEIWLANPAFQKYLGPSVAMKLEILATVLSGTGNLSEIARKHNVTKQSASAMAKRAKAMLRQSGD